VQAALVEKLQSTPGVAANEEAHAVKALRDFARALEALEPAVDSQLEATGRHLDENNLAAVIKERHEEAKRLFKDKQAGMKRLVAEVGGGDDANDRNRRVKGVSDLAELLKAHSTVRRGSLDPNNLPWRTAKAEVRAPVETESGFTTAKFAAAGAKAGTAQPGPEYLAATIDAPQTPAIRAKALELGDHPVAIYNWVRNNIAFNPTYGSAQGAQDTLERRSGNAFDTASLLIALLRSAGIPARYAYGTIDVPVDAARNWVGGVNDATATLQILGQGGIPSTAVVAAGQLRAVRLETVWVEAWVRFNPSRGARHAAGQGDTWVPIDASFKQHAFSQPMNLVAQVPLDANALGTGALQGATRNATEGWIQNINQANVQASFADYQSRVTAYIEQAKPGATIADVIGAQAIIPVNAAEMPGTLPYTTVVKGPKYAALPASLRHQFEFSVFRDDFERSLDSPLFSYRESLPALAGKRVTITFRPASQADADLVASYMPRPHADGSPIQPSELPRSFPAYARVTPELRVDGAVVASGGVVALGTELAGRGGFTRHDLSGWDLTDADTLIAGQTSALGLSIQGVGTAQLQGLRARMEQTRARMQASDYANVAGHDLTDILTSVIWGYFAALQHHGGVQSNHAGMIDRPSFSYGFVHAAAQPTKLFGFITTSIRYTGALLDIGHIRHIRWAKNNDRAAWINYNRMRGIYASALEHMTPERSFVDRSTCNASGAPGSPLPPCPPGYSAVRAMQVAQAQGQKIYTFTTANQAYIGNLALRAETVAEIRNVVSAGREVTVHERPVTVGGWTGAGYTVIDTETGAGGYLIEGRANGGGISLGEGFEILMMSLGLTISLIPFVLIAAYLGVFVLLALTLAILGLILYEAMTMLPEGSASRSFIANLVWGLAFFLVGAAFGVELLLMGVLFVILESILNTIFSRAPPSRDTLLALDAGGRQAAAA
jgi:hypothetical protein